jgi:uncharacterized protein YbaR (Trm112 family)
MALDIIICPKCNEYYFKRYGNLPYLFVCSCGFAYDTDIYDKKKRKRNKSEKNKLICNNRFEIIDL